VVRSRKALRFRSSALPPPARYLLIFGTPPPLPRFIRIMELGRNSRQIFEFKGAIRKIFRNKDLAAQRSAWEMLLGIFWMRLFSTEGHRRNSS